ncbi:MAG TPA: pectinesterase family protein [Tepidisphaeraceae bacterium]
MMRMKWLGAIGILSLAGSVWAAKTITVAADGSADFKDVQSAIDAAPANNDEPTIIHIKPGVYKQRLEIPKNKPLIILRGDDAKTTVLTFDWNSHVKDKNGQEIGTFLSYSTHVAADNFTAENVTFENTSGDHGQGLALSVTGDREIFRNCRFLGWQDTLYINDGRDYFDHCYIEGRVDFIFGNATAMFDHCTIHSKNNPDNASGGYLTAADTKPSSPWGFVFLDCTLTGEGKPTYLGRPWRWYEGSNASVTYLRTKMGPHIRPEGWNKWDQKGNPDTQPATVTRYAEFGSTDLDGKSLDVSQRVDWSHQLSAEQVAQFTVENVLGGEDHWNPEIAHDDAFSPSLGTPGEGRGGGASSFIVHRSSFANNPHPTPPPEYKGKECNVLDYGALPDGNTDDTATLQSAIDACAVHGGGVVTIPAGNYVTGTLWMRSNVSLDIQAGATLLGSQDTAKFPAWVSHWEGPKAEAGRAGLICGENLQNVAITGDGTIDARGQIWWKMVKGHKEIPRPRLLRLVNCQHVRISHLTFTNSPMWTIAPLACDDVTIDGIKIENPQNSPNTDGIDPDSCSNVRVSNCTINVGDDCVAIKAGTETDGRVSHTPCQNISFTNCTMFHGHAGIALGSETTGWIRNVVVSNCIFVGTDRGLRFKSRRGRGGGIENFSADNIIMDGVLCPIAINLFYAPGSSKDNPRITEQTTAFPVDAGTPRFSQLRFDNILARNAKYAAAFIYGLPEAPVDDVICRNVSFYMDPTNTQAGEPEMFPHAPKVARAGLIIQNVNHLTLADCQIFDQVSAAITLHNANDVSIRGCMSKAPSSIQADATSHVQANTNNTNLTLQMQK